MLKSGNDYIAALKGNQPSLFKEVKTNFTPEVTYLQINKGHGRIEKRHVSICKNLDSIRPWPGLTTLIQVKSERQVFTHHVIEVTTETRYYISSLSLTAQEFAERIRGYWGVENKVHYVRDVTQGEDKSRIRTNPLPKIFTIARNFTLNLYRDQMFKNMAQAQRLCSFGLDTLKQLFRMK
ncbi:MAG: ISAs1 family transposase [Moorea sp. SIO4A1]|nr:ISAs1 family transposase [Moorena sp. SIO4A1]